MALKAGPWFRKWRKYECECGMKKQERSGWNFLVLLQVIVLNSQALRLRPTLVLRLPRVTCDTCMTLSGGLCKDLLRFGVGSAFRIGFGVLGSQAQAGTTTPGGVKDRACLYTTVCGEDCDWDRRWDGMAPMVLMPERTGEATNALGARDISGPRAGVEITL